MGKRKPKQERKKKIALVFDESERKDYLCGFRKRKLERKKKAQEEMQRLMKEEVKRIKQENKESYKKLVVSSRPLPDIEQLLRDEYEDDDVNVKIVELSSDTLQKTNLFIGDNKPKPDAIVKEVKKNKKEEHITEIPGMGSDEEENEEEEESKDDVDTEGKSKQEIKSMLKKQATKKIQKSKVFQMKSKLDRIQNKKKSRQKKEHLQKGAAKAKGHRNNPRGDGKGTNNVREGKGKGRKTVDRRKKH